MNEADQNASAVTTSAPFRVAKVYQTREVGTFAQAPDCKRLVDRMSSSVPGRDPHASDEDVDQTLPHLLPAGHRADAGDPGQRT